MSTTRTTSESKGEVTPRRSTLPQPLPGREGGWAVLCAAICAVLVLAACASDPAARSTEARFQKYDYDEVKRRLPLVRPGMRKLDVLTTLGSPASQTDALWQYQPLNPPPLMPVEVLELRFENSVYVGHRLATKLPGL